MKKLIKLILKVNSIILIWFFWLLVIDRVLFWLWIFKIFHFFFSFFDSSQFSTLFLFFDDSVKVTFFNLLLISSEIFFVAWIVSGYVSQLFKPSPLLWNVFLFFLWFFFDIHCGIIFTKIIDKIIFNNKFRLCWTFLLSLFFNSFFLFLILILFLDNFSFLFSMVQFSPLFHPSLFFLHLLSSSFSHHLSSHFFLLLSSSLHISFLLVLLRI